jgi:hypothetical protein
MAEPILEEPLLEHASSFPFFVVAGYSLFLLSFTRLSYHLIHFPNIGIESDAPVEPIPEERLFEPAPLSPIGSAIFFCYSFIIS